MLFEGKNENICPGKHEKQIYPGSTIFHHMIRQIRPVIQLYAERARAAYGGAIEEILLFGSVARGDDHQDSDIDVLVITQTDNREIRSKLIDLAFDLLLETEEYISVKVLPKDMVEERRHHLFFKNVYADAITV
jgi:predicted nucleotidyltransferase